MHEFGIATSALQMVLDHAGQHAGATVARVVVRVGALSGVDGEALKFAFEAAAAGTAAASARFEIETIAAVAHCARCNLDFEAGDDLICACPQCGAFSGDLRQGRELDLAHIELTV